jgi:hypothetical protein
MQSKSNIINDINDIEKNDLNICQILELLKKFKNINLTQTFINKFLNGISLNICKQLAELAFISYYILFYYTYILYLISI